MNLVRILLLVFLIYAAMKQKSEESRNVVLIVTGLLAVCMMNKEGFDNIVRLKTGSDSLCPSSSYDSMNTFSDIDDSCSSGKVVNDAGTGCTDAPPPPNNMSKCVASKGCCGSNAVCSERPLWGDSVRKDDDGNDLNVCGTAGLLGLRTKTCTCSYSPASTWTEGADNNCADPPSPS